MSDAFLENMPTVTMLIRSKMVSCMKREGLDEEQMLSVLAEADEDVCEALASDIYWLKVMRKGQ